MPALTFQEAKARVLGPERANEPIRKGSKEYEEIIKLMKVTGFHTLNDVINTQNIAEATKVSLNLKDAKSVNPLRRPPIVMPEKEFVSKEEFLSVEVNRNAFSAELFRQKHLRNL